MLGEEAAAEAMERILAGPRPHDTLKVWLAIMLSTDWNTHEVTAKAPTPCQRWVIPNSRD